MTLQSLGWNKTLNKRFNGSQFASCCGSKYNPLVTSSVDRKWKNQYGEGVIKGEPLNPAPKGISLFDGKKYEEVSDEFTEIKHLKTRQGLITIAVRKKW